MTARQRKVLARIFRRQAQLMADVPALISLLDTHEKTGTVPVKWREMWAELRESDEYRAVLQEFEPAISLLESSSDEKELIEILQKISSGKLPN